MIYRYRFLHGSHDLRLATTLLPSSIRRRYRDRPWLAQVKRGRRMFSSHPLTANRRAMSRQMERRLSPL